MPTSAALTVWVIEDDPAFRETLAFLIDHTSGMACGRAFHDVESALELLHAYAGRATSWSLPDVLLLDVNLPGMSGLDALEQLKTLLPAARILMLTIRDDADTIYAALQAGASGFLVKNAGVDQILAAIREAHLGGMLMPAPVARRVLGFFQQQRRDTPNYGLTDREQEVLHEMSLGFTQKEIAERLFVSPSTVNTHVQHIYEKLHVHSGIEAVAKALRERLI